VFNKTTSLNSKQEWRLALSFLKEWKVPFKDLEGEKQTVHGPADVESQKSIVAVRKLTCQDFECVSTWRSTSSTAKHGGRASLAFLQVHPDESCSIHVVL
jgi:hypothetical protein